MRDKYYINLNDKEYFNALSSLVSKRNKLIQSGKYTDGIDEGYYENKKVKEKEVSCLLYIVSESDRRISIE